MCLWNNFRSLAFIFQSGGAFVDGDGLPIAASVLGELSVDDSSVPVCHDPFSTTTQPYWPLHIELPSTAIIFPAAACTVNNCSDHAMGVRLQLLSRH